MQRKVEEVRESGQLSSYSIDSLEYYQNGTIYVELAERSDDGDYVIDFIIKHEHHLDRTITSYFDYDADGVWDKITTQ